MFKFFVPGVRSMEGGQAVSPDAVMRRKGVCLLYGQNMLGDVETLGCSWYYDYAATLANLSDNRYVPMSWGGGVLAGLPAHWGGYLLALNEPDNAGQLNISPAEGARRMRELQAAFPRARLIVGGVSFFGGAWLTGFVKELGDWRPAGWHVHGYCEWSLSAEVVMNWFKSARMACPGGVFWVTEFADVSQGRNQAQDLLRLVGEAGWIDRFAWFANRTKSGEWFLPGHWSDPALVDGNGQLSQFGILYKGG